VAELARLKKVVFENSQFRLIYGTVKALRIVGRGRHIAIGSGMD
jgi:hypothetical protein